MCSPRQLTLHAHCSLCPPPPISAPAESRPDMARGGTVTANVRCLDGAAVKIGDLLYVKHHAADTRFAVWSGCLDHQKGGAPSITDQKDLYELARNQRKEWQNNKEEGVVF